MQWPELFIQDFKLTITAYSRLFIYLLVGLMNDADTRLLDKYGYIQLYKELYMLHPPFAWPKVLSHILLQKVCSQLCETIAHSHFLSLTIQRWESTFIHAKVGCKNGWGRGGNNYQTFVSFTTKHSHH